jgi:hypothetical protein
MTTENPWETMEYNANGIHIAPCDKEAIDKLVSSGEWRWDKNKLIKCKKSKEEKIIEFNYLPQPYMGDPEQAEIFLLNGNPDAKDDPTVLSHKEFNEKHKKYILISLENRVKDYPLYALNPQFKCYYIHKWWYEHLHFLWDDKKSRTDLQTASKKVFAAEYFPYFSKNLSDTNNIPILESQKYTFSLVEEAIKAEKFIVIMRAKDKWHDSVKGLKKYSNKKYKDADGKEYSRVIELRTKNGNRPQRVWVSRENMNSEDFDRILNLLTAPPKP